MEDKVEEIRNRYTCHWVGIMDHGRVDDDIQFLLAELSRIREELDEVCQNRKDHIVEKFRLKDELQAVTKERENLLYLTRANSIRLDQDAEERRILVAERDEVRKERDALREGIAYHKSYLEKFGAARPWDKELWKLIDGACK